MSVNTAEGVSWAIGTTTPCSTLMEYEADTYVTIDEVEDGGQIGDEATFVSFTALADGRTRKFKGPFDAGTVALVCGADTLDVGQQALVAALPVKLNYNFRVILADPTTITGEGTILYFSGQVGSDRRNIGAVNNIVKRTFNIAVNTAILEVDPT